MIITIKGRIPAKKNSRINTRSGRSFPSTKYTEWHKDASFQIKGTEKIPNGSFIFMHFYLPDNRRTDLSNKAESVMDLLVDNGVIEDDCWQVIPKLALEGIKVDKENPRVEIYITTVPVHL